MSLLYDENKDWKVCIIPSKNGFESISYVNGGFTPNGTHVDYILNQIINIIKNFIKKKYKTDITGFQIKQHIRVMICCTVVRPVYNSQTKETLITEPKNFGTKFEVSDKFASQICKSELLNIITDWLDKKKIADESKAEREANKTIAKVKVDKLVDCRWAGTLKKSKTSLSITEGDSAASGFRKFRDPNTQALISIKGKILNVRTASKNKIRANTEIIGIMSAMGLKFGESPFIYRNGKVFKDNLRIHEIRISSDQDFDGYHISGLLVNFFAFFWPELFKEHRVARIDTPIIIARQGKKVEKIYYQYEYDEWCKKNNPSKWVIEYNKGLGSLTDNDYKELVQNPRLYYYELDEFANKELDIWFGSDSEKRKQKL